MPWGDAGDTLWQQFHNRAPCAVEVQLEHQWQVGHGKGGKKRSLFKLDLPAD